jgi:hypothetical protein
MLGMHLIRRDVQKECREKLIMLLYCSMNLTHVAPGELAFALPHAVNLAGMGRTLRDKQLGMIFIIEKLRIPLNTQQNRLRILH